MEEKNCKIDNDKKYTLNEIVDGNFIKGISGYRAVYHLATVLTEDKDGKGHRSISNKTTKTSLKAQAVKNPWGKVIKRLLIKGSEINKFLELTGLKK